MMQPAGEKRPRAIVAAVLRQLAKTLGFEVVGKFAQKRAGFESAAYFGTGKREELRLLREQESVDSAFLRVRGEPEAVRRLHEQFGRR